jgi:hypothetical protein
VEYQGNFLLYLSKKAFPVLAIGLAIYMAIGLACLNVIAFID